MKIFLAILFSILAFQLKAQNKFVGAYHNYYEGELKINADSTFNYTWHFDLASSWSNGKWEIINDTVFFKIIPVYDTVKYRVETNIITDSLIRSPTEKAESFTSAQYKNMLLDISSEGQNRRPAPIKLYYRKGKLFGINNNGKLIKGKVKGFGTKKKYPNYFIRQRRLAYN